MKRKESSIVDELKEKYKERLARAQQKMEEGEAKGESEICSESNAADVSLFQKWAYRVGKGWYGFKLGYIPEVWTDMLDDFLTWLESQCPNFEIWQIKMKFGSLRFHVNTNTMNGSVNEKIHAEVDKLEALLRTPWNIRMNASSPPLTRGPKKRRKSFVAPYRRRSIT
jgi:hypothetical protein